MPAFRSSTWASISAATIGPLLVAWFADRFGWRWGFALPAFGMAFGVAQFLATRRYLGSAGA